jgi:two-component system response regulator WspF
LLSKIETIARLIAEGQAPAAHGRGALVAMGASAGGPGALAAVLGGLPRDFPAAVVIVQHVDARFAPGLVDWLGHHSAMPVRLAAEGERVVSGQVLVAGTDDHLVFKGADRLGYTPHPQDHAYRPSVDVMFASARRHWAGALAGVLLTGMGSDGARACVICERRVTTPSRRIRPAAPSTACPRLPPPLARPARLCRSTPSRRG